MRAFPVVLPSGGRYWTVLDEDLAVVPVADGVLAAGGVPAATGGVDDEELCALDRVVPALVRPDGPDLAGGRRAARVVHDLACARGAGALPRWCPRTGGGAGRALGARRPGERAGSTAC